MHKTMLAALALTLLPFLGSADDDNSGKDKADDNSGNGFDHAIRRSHTNLFREGRHIFRYDTFGDETFWGDALKLHLALAGENGGIGPGVIATKAQCATCHVPPIFTEPGWNLHTPAEIGIDDFQANRSPDKRYRTTPLKGLFPRAKGGFYHDGRFATLADVVNHYDGHLNTGLTDAEKADLVEYLKSL
jgi:hypothetical protein